MALVAVLVASTVAFGQEEATPASGEFEEPPPIIVANAERISLRFQDQPELTGEYRVNADGTLSVPVIGRIPLSAMSPSELEEALTAKLTDFTGRQSYVTVEVVAYRPVYVTGFVGKPGAVEWQPGLTVLQAEALAGGIYREPERAGNLSGSSRSEALRSLRMGRETQKRLVAQLSRLKTEAAGESTIKVPPMLVGLVGEAEAASLIERQQALLDSRLAGIKKKMEALERGSMLANDELKGLDEQELRVNEQLETRRTMQAKIATLLEKGLVPQERRIEGELRMGELEEKATNVAVARARVQSTTAGFNQEMISLQDDRKAGIAADIAKAEADLAEVTIDLETAMQSLGRIDDEMVKTAAISMPRMTTQYTVVRRTDAGEKRAAAQTSSYLSPGDVLIVSQTVQENQGAVGKDAAGAVDAGQFQ